MSHEELARELADFWLPALRERDWEGCLEVLDEIHAQLYQDLPTIEEYESVTSRFVAAVIERFGAPPINNAAQARIYAASASEEHIGAAFAWEYGDRVTNAEEESARAAEPPPWGHERRRWPRRMVDKLTRAWIRGEAIRCRLVDLSKGGARIATFGGAALPEPGTPIRVAVPEGEVREAVVVFSRQGRAGVQFAGDQRAA